MSELFSREDEKREKIKSIIRRIHSGEDPELLKREFSDVLKGVRPDEIAKIEEELIREGLPREDIQRLCEIHLDMFKDAIAGAPRLAPEEHPIGILMNEHNYMQDAANRVSLLAKDLRSYSSFQDSKQVSEQIYTIVLDLKDSESHYLREENVLFPYLERHGVTQPPAIMWMEHQTIRETKKKLYELLDNKNRLQFNEFSEQLFSIAVELAELLSSHFFKENNILFPTAMRLFTEPEWNEIASGFDEIGYPSWSKVFRPVKASTAPKTRIATSGSVEFETGFLNINEIEAILNTVPFDITFVDADDKVRYFNQSKDRIFPRTKAVLGRTVQNCHPQKSIYVVNQILDEFKSGKRDVAEFWINKAGRLIFIRYYPVRDHTGKYLGCVEVTQDITEIKNIEGEKRLL